MDYTLDNIVEIFRKNNIDEIQKIIDQIDSIECMENTDNILLIKSFCNTIEIFFIRKRWIIN